MNRSEREPPRMAEYLLLKVVPPGVAGRSIAGDAREEYLEYCRSKSLLPAPIWYWIHIMPIIARFISGKSASKAPVVQPYGGLATRLGNLATDLRIALRMLRRKTGFTAAAILTLGLGIGANTTIFSLVDGILLRPLPYPDADRLVGVYRIDPEVTGPDPDPAWLINLWAVPYAVFEDWRDMSPVFEAAGAHHEPSFTLTGGDQPERLSGAMVTSGVFEALGVAPLLGRPLIPSDDEVGAPMHVVLSHGLWQRRYGGDPEIVSKSMVLNGTSYEIVGVMPRGFGFPFGQEDVWVSFDDARKTRPVRNAGYLQVIARIKPGVTLAQAQREMDAVARRNGELHPEEVEHGIGLFSHKELLVADSRSGLLLLLGAVGLVLLIACANIANLLLVRATERRRELGVRQALGAGRGRLLTQHLSESIVIALAGGVAGALVAVGTLRPFVAAFPGDLPRAY
ncbi:MAG: ABC transporter permease, partial [Gemmatimonadota bacterium]